MCQTERNNTTKEYYLASKQLHKLVHGEMAATLTSKLINEE